MTDFNIPSEMRALTLSGTGIEHLNVERIPTPRPGPNQLLARVDAAGICTSLIKLIDQGPAHSYVYGRDIARYPLILGDEGAVTLVEVGEGLRDRYRPGERYVIQPAVDHPPINFRERYRDNGRGVQKLGVGYSLPGHLAEYILIQEEILAAGCLLPLPSPDMAAAHVAMSEPLSCVISAQDHHMHLVQSNPLEPRGVIKGLRPGGVTVIMGAGAMGRMHVELALSYRPRVVICSDLLPERLDIVRRLFGTRAAQLGVELRAVNSAETDLKALIDEVTDFRGADDVIVAVGSARAIETAQTYVGRGAVLNLFGGLKRGQDVVGFDTTTIHYKEINVTGSSGGSPWDVARTLELMAAGEVDAGNHITRIGDLEHAPAFLDMIKAQTLDGKAVVYPHRRTSEILSVPRWTAEDERRYLQAG
jgi:threonine dehydrogenase-like Zn-dependent dehydrogenase